MLGQKGNVITNIELIRTFGGCEYMCRIDSDEMARSMYRIIKAGCFPAGIARITLEDEASTDNCGFGNGLYDILRQTTAQGLSFTSLSWYGFTVKMPNKNKQDYINYSYKIV